MSAAALVLVIGGVYQARTAMESSLIAVFLAMLGTPPVLWLERKRVPSVVAVLLVVTGMVTPGPAADRQSGQSVEPDSQFASSNAST